MRLNMLEYKQMLVSNAKEGHLKLEETATVELKRQYTPIIAKEIIAFANSNGGTLYIGVEDDGNIIGLADAPSVELSVNALIHDAITPDLTLFAEATVEQFDDVDVIVVRVHQGPSKPYCLRGIGLRPEGVFVRQGTSAQPIPFDAIKRMIAASSPETFECSRSLEQHLTFNAACSALEGAEIDFTDAGKTSLGITTLDGSFTNMGLLLSDQCPFSIKIARFKGTRKAEFQTRRECNGSLFDQLSNAFEMLDMLNNLTATFDNGPARQEQRDYPEQALREALLNAVAHRDYCIASNIFVNLYDDRCEIISPGGLPQGNTAEAALAGVSVARNEKLCQLLYRMKLIEAYGTGLSKIICSYNELEPKPQIKFLDGAVVVILPNRNWEGKAQDTESANSASVCRSEMVYAIESLTYDEETLLEALQEEEVFTKQAAAKAVGFNPAKCARLLRSLVEKGFLLAQGNTRSRTYRFANRIETNGHCPRRVGTP